MRQRTGPERFPSVQQLGGWERMVNSILAALPPSTATPTAAADSERMDWLVAKGAPAVQYLAMAEPDTWRERIDAARHQEIGRG